MRAKLEVDREELTQLLFDRARQSGLCDDLAFVAISGPINHRDYNWNLAGMGSTAGEAIFSGPCRTEVVRLAREFTQQYQLVVGRMPTRTRAQLEQACLPLAQEAAGCHELVRVEIRPLYPRGAGPNWAPSNFEPALDPAARQEAISAIMPLMQRYALGS